MSVSKRVLTVLLVSTLVMVSGKKLRIRGMGQSYPPWGYVEDGVLVKGFVPDVYEAVITLMGYDYEILNLGPGDFSDILKGSVTLLKNNTVDIAWAAEDTIDRVELMRGIAITMPIVQTNVVAIGRKEISSGRSDCHSFTKIFAPFSMDVWIALAISALWAAIVSVLLGFIIKGRIPTIACFATALYHSLASLLGGETDEDDATAYLQSWPGRIHRLGLLFLVLISSATYTANLAAMLTTPNILYHGPQTMEELKSARVCHAFPWHDNDIKSFVGSLVKIPDDIAPTDGLAVNEWMKSALLSGECDCIINLDVNAHVEVLNNCDTLYIPSDISFNPSYIYNVMRGSTQEEQELALKFSAAVMKIQGSPMFEQILRDNFKYGIPCPDPESDEDHITLGHSWSMFAIYFLFSCAAIVVGAFSHVYSMHVVGTPQSKSSDFEGTTAASIMRLESTVSELHAKMELLVNQGMNISSAKAKND